jgi:glycerol uptake facilitator protein
MVQGGTRRWRWAQTTLGELVAEFLGTMIILAFGDGVVAMVVAALPGSGRSTTSPMSANWLLISWAWGFAVAFAVWVAGGVSGAHLNPAVTLALAARRGFSWRKVPAFWLAQVAGAFVGAALVWSDYHTAIDALNHSMHIIRGTEASLGTYSIFSTFPAPYFHSVVGPLVDQVIGTAFLVAFIFAITDEYNAPIKGNLAPLGVGLIVVLIGMSFGADAGYAINPARDLGPRLWAWIVGYRKLALPGDFAHINDYMWVPIVGPLIGAVLGGTIYDYAIRKVLIARGATPDPEMVEQGADSVDESSGGAHNA